MNKLSLSYQTIIRLFLQILAVLGLIGAIAWFIFEPGFEPILALLGSITTFLTSFFFNNAETIPPTPLPDECEFMAEIQIGSLEARAVQINESGDVDAFRRDYQEHFGGRQTELAELDNWLTQTETCLGLLVAPAGMGKSALVANWVKRLEEEQTAVVIYHPISLRYGTNSKKQTLFSLLDQMSKTAQKESRSLQLHSMAGLDLIDQYLSLYQVKELCAYLAVNYDDLGQEGKRANSLRLIQRCQRERRIEALVVACQKIRSDLDWTEAFSTFVLEQLDYEPPFVGSDIEALNAQLRSNLRKPARPEKPLLVIVDGLDELEDQLNQPKIKRVDFLPNDVGHNVYVLAVARGETKDREAWQDALRWRETAIRSFHLPKLNQNDIEAMVRRNKLVLDERHLPQLTNQIYGLSEDGDPLIASLWIGWLKDNPFDTIQAQIAFLQAQKPGANKYIEGVLNQLAPVMTESAMPLFEVLSLARGPLTVNDLSALGIGVHSTQLDKLVGLSGRLITQTGTAYVLSHSRLRHAIQDEYVKETRLEWFEKFHRYGRCALKQAQQIPNPSQNIIPDYLLNYYADHLQEGIAYYNDLLGKTDLVYKKRNELEKKRMACQESLYALVDQTWMTAHYYHFKHYDNFLRDVDVAWEIATLEGPQRIALQVKSVLCHAHITSLSNNLPPHLPALLARDEIWTPIQAIAHTRRITDLAQQTRTLVALLTVNRDGEESVFKPYLQDIVSDALQNMATLWQQNKVDEGEMFELQLAILPFLHSQHFKDAIDLALKIQHAIHRTRLLAELLRLTEDPYQHHPIIKEIIEAGSKINNSVYESDTPFIIPTFTILVQNLSIKQLAVAFSEIWEADTHIIEEYKGLIAQARIKAVRQDDEFQELRQKCDEYQKVRNSRRNIFNYLAWHIESNQALTFIEMLFQYEDLPDVAEKIGRFAYKLDPQIAYSIAVRLQDEFENTSEDKRKSGGYFYEIKGIGMGLLMLALGCQEEECKQNILQICRQYIDTHGKSDFPYDIEDLIFLYQIAYNKLADAHIAERVRQRKALRRFWKTSMGEKDDHRSTELAKYSQELVAYLGIQTLKTLFERCTRTEIQESARWWKISNSPYILPAIAQKLPDEEWPLIYEIGNARYDHANYGYIRATENSIERIAHMSESIKLDILKWAFHSPNGHNSQPIIARLIAPNMISREENSLINPSLGDYKLPRIVQSLPQETLQHIICKFKSEYSGGYFLQFLRYLPNVHERKQHLEEFKEDILKITDKGETEQTLNVLTSQASPSKRRKLKMMVTEILTVYSLKEFGYKTPSSGWGNLFWKYAQIYDYHTSLFSDILRDVSINLRHSPRVLLQALVVHVQMLYLNKATYLAIQTHQERLGSWIEEEIPHSNRPLSLLAHWYFKGYIKRYKNKIRRLSSSRLIWTIYLFFAIVYTTLLLLTSLVTGLLSFLLAFPLLVAVILWHLVEERHELVGTHRQKDPISWEEIKQQVTVLNQLAEAKEREQAFVGIAYQLASICNYIDTPDYKKYAKNAEQIWSNLKPEFVVDALSVLKNYDTYNNSFGDADGYLRAIIPVVVLKNKSLLSELIPHIEYPYPQFKGRQYACLAYYLTGAERLYYLEKSVDSFPSEEFSESTIPYVLTEVAEYATADLIPHLLNWLQKYPVATALEELAPKIVDNKVYLAQAFAIAEKINGSVTGFMANIAPSLDKEWTAKTIIWVMQRNIGEEHRECIPQLVDRWLKLPPKEIYEVWTEVLKAMKPYPRHRVLPFLSQFAGGMVTLSGSNQMVNVAQEIISVSSWWNIVWEKSKRHWDD